MKRKIIKINEDLCNGCGSCIPGCPEGALQVIDGKARLISDIFCDGLGACLGECPLGAISIEERDAVPYSEKEAMKNIVLSGKETIRAHLKHLKEHNEDAYYNEAINYLKENNIAIPDIHTKKIDNIPCGCPGSMMRELTPTQEETNIYSTKEAKSQLSQWPIQLHLINPHAPYFNNADLLIAADCVPFSYADFHQNFLRNRKLIIFCPKLDSDIDTYIEKLSELFSNQTIKSITIVHMEVPCCFGTNQVVNEALSNAGKKIPVKEFNISIDGKIIK